MEKEKNYYEILGVSTLATQDEIRDAYLRKIKTFHPDTYAGNRTEAEEITAKLNIAYSVLKDSAKKAEYDKQNGINKTNKTDFSNANNAKNKTNKTFKQNDNQKNSQESYQKDESEDLKENDISKSADNQPKIPTEKLVLDGIIIFLLIVIILLIIVHWKRYITNKNRIKITKKYLT